MVGWAALRKLGEFDFEGACCFPGCFSIPDLYMNYIDVPDIIRIDMNRSSCLIRLEIFKTELCS